MCRSGTTAAGRTLTCLSPSNLTVYDPTPSPLSLPLPLPSSSIHSTHSFSGLPLIRHRVPPWQREPILHRWQPLLHFRPLPLKRLVYPLPLPPLPPLLSLSLSSLLLFLFFDLWKLWGHHFMFLRIGMVPSRAHLSLLT